MQWGQAMMSMTKRSDVGEDEFGVVTTTIYHSVLGVTWVL